MRKIIKNILYFMCPKKEKKIMEEKPNYAIRIVGSLQNGNEEAILAVFRQFKFDTPEEAMNFYRFIEATYNKI